MTHPQKTLLATIVVALLSIAHGQAASITSAGSLVNLTPTGFNDGGDVADLDANNLGGDGFVLFNSTPEGGNLSGEPWNDNLVDNKPAYISAINGSGSTSSGGWANYDDVRIGGNTYNTGGIVTSPGNGSQASVFTFTIGANAPSNLRVGLIVDNSDSSSWGVSNVRLEGPGNISADQDTPRDGGTDLVQFDIAAPAQGEIYTVSGTSPPSGLLYGGITFETGLDISDPTDSDNDGMGDNWETFHFGNLARDGAGDADSDGLDDLGEWESGTLPNEPDSDSDDLSDGQEVGTFGTDPLDPDSDDDGFSDGDEVAAGTNPNSAASFPVVEVPRPVPGSTNT
ncbi:MAG: hypothetical protein ACR2RV_03055, partial [Verrucomicrobiales bacterium]